jgi:hypothetical protein
VGGVEREKETFPVPPQPASESVLIEATGGSLGLSKYAHILADPCMEAPEFNTPNPNFVCPLESEIGFTEK